MNNIILTVPEEASGLRLDKWLTSQIEDLTRTAVQNLVESGGVLVNGCLLYTSDAADEL